MAIHAGKNLDVALAMARWAQRTYSDRGPAWLDGFITGIQLASKAPATATSIRHAIEVTSGRSRGETPEQIEAEYLSRLRHYTLEDEDRGS